MIFLLLIFCSSRLYGFFPEICAIADDTFHSGYVVITRSSVRGFEILCRCGRSNPSLLVSNAKTYVFGMSIFKIQTIAHDSLSLI